MAMMSKKIIELPNMRNREHVFADRDDAGRVLAEMLESDIERDALVLGIPAGGVPVAAAMARQLNLPLDVAVVSKITLPWNTEAGYGAVAFDGTVRLNDELVLRQGLDAQLVEEGIETTKRKVIRRVKKLRGDRMFSEVAGRPLILVDDGLASGFTLRVAVEALQKQGANRIHVAVPTGHADSVREISQLVEAIYCANIREGWSFAVADAYQRWVDVEEDDIIDLLIATPADP